MANVKKSENSNNFLLLISSALLIFLIILIYVTSTDSPSQETVPVVIGRAVVSAEVADTEEERIKGLSGREILAKDKGMIFIFPDAGIHSFWMKGMNFALDIIWINEGEVVDITYNAQPEIGNTSSYQIYKPNQPAKYVLEVNTGFAKENEIKIGDVVKSPIF